jgi:hypothetical protein
LTTAALRLAAPRVVTADLDGITMAHAALQRALKGKPQPKVDGLSTVLESGQYGRGRCEKHSNILVAT